VRPMPANHHERRRSGHPPPPGTPTHQRDDQQRCNDGEGDSQRRRLRMVHPPVLTRFGGKAVAPLEHDTLVIRERRLDKLVQEEHQDDVCDGGEREDTGGEAFRDAPEHRRQAGNDQQQEQRGAGRSRQH
jgi:hypothetical protein